MNKHHKSAEEKLSVFTIDDALLDQETLELAKSIASHNSVHKVIALPDIFMKPKMESPSSFAVSTYNDIVPHFSSTGLNCGMTVITTDITKEDLSNQNLDKFFELIKPIVPMNRETPVVSREEIIQACLGGGEWAVDRFGLEPQTPIFIENGGKTGNLDRQTLVNLSTSPMLDKARFNFGQLGGGNHFFELQVVSDIYSPEIAKQLGLYQDQVCIMFHGGPGSFGLMGRVFARRRYTALRHKIKLFPLKMFVHKTINPFTIKKRHKYYFSREEFVPINADSDEGFRLEQVTDATMNIGAAFRMCIFAHVTHALKLVFGDSSQASLLYDSPHNSIYREEHQGQNVWMHRHNACRCYPSNKFPNHPVFSSTGQVALLPGDHISASHLAVPGPQIEKTMYTVNHGFGETISQMYQRGLLSSVDNRLNTTTRRYESQSNNVAELNHLPDEAVDRSINSLETSGLIDTVAKLRPRANIRS